MKKILKTIFPYSNGNRITHKQYQKNIALSLIFILPLFILVALWGIVSFISANTGIDNPSQSIFSGIYSSLFLLTALGFLVSILIILVNSIKRLHDFNRSGWWILIGYIPFVGLVQACYLLFKKGDSGTNLYGEKSVDSNFSLYENILRFFGISFYFLLIVASFSYSLIGSSLPENKEDIIVGLVKEAKSSMSLPSKIDEVTILKDIKAEKDAILYQYTLSGLDKGSLNSKILKDSFLGEICSDNDVKSILNKDISIKYEYLDIDNNTSYFVEINKNDCFNYK